MTGWLLTWSFFGTVLTVDDARPTAEALAVADGRIVAVGDRADVQGWIGPDTEIVDLGDGCVMPGFVEAHGHPLMEAIVLADRIVDIRPVTMRGRRRRGRRDPPTRSPSAVPTAPTSTAGIRCCRTACPSRRWRGSTAWRPTPRW